MGFRFSRRIKIAPGVRVNLGKTGASVSLGGRRAKITVGNRGVRSTVGIPGSGLSYSEYSSFSNSNKNYKTNSNIITHQNSSHPLQLNFLQRLFMNKERVAFIDGLKEFTTGNKQVALSFFKNAKNIVDSLFMIGMIEQSNENYDKSLNAFEEVLSKSYKLGDTFNKYGINFQLCLNLPNQLSIPVISDIRGLMIGMAKSYAGLEMHQEAFDLLWDLYINNNDNLEIKVMLIDLILEVESDESLYKEIINMTGNLENKAPTHTLLLLYKARALRKLNMFTGARDTLSLALRRKKDRPLSLLHELLYERGEIYEELNQKARAKSSFEKIYMEDPNFKDVSQKLF